MQTALFIATRGTRARRVRFHFGVFFKKNVEGGTEGCVCCCIFPPLFFGPGDDERLLGQQAGRFWSSLAAFHDPNAGLPLAGGVDPATNSWPPYSLETDEAMVLNAPVATATAPMSGLKAAHCDFWDANPIPPEAIFGNL